MTRLSIAAAVARFLAFGGAAFLSLAVAARADIISGSYSGTVDGNTIDTYGLFGSTGASLSGDTISGSYSYDTSVASFYSAEPAFDDYLGTGGLTLSVTVGGNTVATAGVTNTEIMDTQDGTDTEVTLANFAPAPLIEFNLIVEGAWVPGVTIDTPFMLDATYFQQTIYVTADGSHYDVLNFGGSSAPVPAPEPGSLALLSAGIAGFGWIRRGSRCAAGRRPLGGRSRSIRVALGEFG